MVRISVDAVATRDKWDERAIATAARAHRHGSECQARARDAGHNQSDAGRARPARVQEQRGGHLPDSGQQAVAAAATHGPPAAFATAAAVGLCQARQEQVQIVCHNVVDDATTAAVHRVILINIINDIVLFGRRVRRIRRANPVSPELQG